MPDRNYIKVTPKVGECDICGLGFTSTTGAKRCSQACRKIAKDAAQRVRHSRWRAANREHVNELTRARRYKDLEASHVAERIKSARHRQNPVFREKARLATRDWNRRNPGRSAKNTREQRNRRAKLLTNILINKLTQETENHAV